MIFLWFMAGILTGIFSGLTQQWTVNQLHVNSTKKVTLLLIGGFFVRIALAGIVLFAAVQQGIIPALLAFAGLWFARWGLSLYWHKTQVYSGTK